MTCAICNRTISQSDVQRKRYVYSAITGAHYCMRCATGAK